MTSSHKIENPRTSLSETSTFNDLDILCAALSTEKYLCNSYMTAMHDASHEKYYTLIFDMLKDTSKQQRKLFDLQFQHGWHSFTQASTTEITELVQHFNHNRQQLQ